MIKHLPQGFECNKYGLHVRFVNEGDAEFILSLRTNPKLSRFIHSTDNDIEEQRKWIRDYKQREVQGIDYYFIYDSEGEQIGVNRIYDMIGNHCTGGSWVCSPNVDSTKSLATIFFSRDIMFEQLCFEEEIFQVSKGNNQVKKFHEMTGAKIYDENDIEYHFKLAKEDYLKKRQKIIKLLNIV